jgi:hypothetical protein
LQGRRLTGRARRLVREVYQQLQAGEVLSPQAATRVDPSDGGPPPRGGPAPGSPPGDDLPSAARPEQTNGKGALRATFLRLAQALHPDRASNTADAQTREEAMKAVNRAYHEGDLARLLEIQQLWAFSGSAGSPTEEIAQREKALEETNQALQQQLTALRRACRQLQRSDIGRMVSHMKRGSGDPGERFIQEGREEIERMVQLRDFVRAFRDGQISLEAFVAGPDAGGPGELDEEFEAAVTMLADWIERSAAAPPRPPRNRNRKRSSRPRR